MLWGTLAASVVENMSVHKGVIRDGERKIHAGQHF